LRLGYQDLATAIVQRCLDAAIEKISGTHSSSTRGRGIDHKDILLSDL
jgi:hypothetical protein